MPRSLFVTVSADELAVIKEWQHAYRIECCKQRDNMGQQQYGLD